MASTVKWREIRKAAGISLHRASADAEVTPTTARAFELGGEDAITDSSKREALMRVYRAMKAGPRDVP